MSQTLQIRHGSTIARVVPDRGFNCYSLEVDGFDYLNQAPDFLPDGSPTRSGCPILFPWPNRIAGSRFTWGGADYELPVTEAATGASLHGFACHSPWRVLEVGEHHVTGEFLLSRDAPGQQWPADAGLRITYEVGPRALIISSEVFAGDDRDLPFGLGFHPYFRVPGRFDRWRLQCDASATWPLAQMVPTGDVIAVPARLDFRNPRHLRDDHLDDVLTGLPATDAMAPRAALMCEQSALTVSSDPTFREYVVFTPASRDAVAIEPYTCTTDAVHLSARSVDGGWRVLPARQTTLATWRVDIS